MNLKSIEFSENNGERYYHFWQELVRRMYSKEHIADAAYAQQCRLEIARDFRKQLLLGLARNRYICEAADEIIFIGASESSSLFPLAKQFQSKTVTL